MQTVCDHDVLQRSEHTVNFIAELLIAVAEVRYDDAATIAPVYALRAIEELWRVPGCLVTVVALTEIDKA